MIDFLLGAGIGFIEEGLMICLHCGYGFMEEEIPSDNEKRICRCFPSARALQFQE